MNLNVSHKINNSLETLRLSKNWYSVEGKSLHKIYLCLIARTFSPALEASFSSRSPASLKPCSIISYGVLLRPRRRYTTYDISHPHRLTAYLEANTQDAYSRCYISMECYTYNRVYRPICKEKN